MTAHVQKCYIGVDVSKDRFDVFVWPQGEYAQFEHSPGGIQQILSLAQQLPEVLIAMESTGGYEKPLALTLAQAELPVAVVNPKRVRDLAKSKGKLAKTDRLDAQMIALYAVDNQPLPNVQWNEDQQTLEDYAARRRQLVDMITMEKNRLDKASPSIKKSLQHIIRLLEKELNDIQDVLQQSIQSNADYERKNKLLQSVKGVGAVVAAHLMAELPELGQLKAKQISALVGLAPMNHDSGKLRGRRAIRGGRACVRRTLYMATLVATRHNPTIKAFYQRLCSSGKKKKIALTACMHKLLIIMNAMIKSNQPWSAHS